MAEQALEAAAPDGDGQPVPRPRQGRQLPTVPPTVYRRSLPPSPRSPAPPSSAAGPPGAKLKAALRDFFGLQSPGESSTEAGAVGLPRKREDGAFSGRLSRSKSASPTSGRRGLVLTLVRSDSPTNSSVIQASLCQRSHSGTRDSVGSSDARPPLRSHLSLQDPRILRRSATPTHAQRIIAAVRSKSTSSSPSGDLTPNFELLGTPRSPTESCNSRKAFSSPTEPSDRSRHSWSPRSPGGEHSKARKATSPSEHSPRSGILKSPRSPVEATDGSEPRLRGRDPTSPTERKQRKSSTKVPPPRPVSSPGKALATRAASTSGQRTDRGESAIQPGQGVDLIENFFQPVVPARRLKGPERPPPPQVARFVSPKAPVSVLTVNVLTTSSSSTDASLQRGVAGSSEKGGASPPVSERTVSPASPVRDAVSPISPTSILKASRSPVDSSGRFSEAGSSRSGVVSPASGRVVSPTSSCRSVTSSASSRSVVSPRSSLAGSGTVSPRSPHSNPTSLVRAKSQKKYPAPSPPTSPPAPKSSGSFVSPTNATPLRGAQSVASKSRLLRKSAGIILAAENPARSKSPPELSVGRSSLSSVGRKTPLRSTKSDPESSHLKAPADVRPQVRQLKSSRADRSVNASNGTLPSKPSLKRAKMESDVTESDVSDIDVNTFARRSLNSPHLVTKGDGTGNSRSKRQYEHNWAMEPEQAPPTPTKRQRSRSSGAYSFQRGEETSEDGLELTDDAEEEDNDASRCMVPREGDIDFQRADVSPFVPVGRRTKEAPPTEDHGYQGSPLKSKMAESSSSFDSNTDETLSESSSPVHQPVYGRYRKLHHGPDDESRDEDGNYIERLILHRLPGENLGMILGVEASQDGSSLVESVVVKSVTLGGAAYRATGGTSGICVGDELLEINGKNLRLLNHDECLSIFQEMPLRVELTVRRAQAPRRADLPVPPRGSGPGARAGRGRAVFYDSTASEQSDVEEGLPQGFRLLHVQVAKPPEATLGLSIVPSYGSTRDYYQIKRLLPSGVCAQSGRLQVGDRLVACNGFKLRRITQTQCLSVLKNSGDSVLLTVLRQEQHDSPLEIQVSKTSGSCQSEPSDRAVRERKVAAKAVNGVGASPTQKENRIEGDSSEVDLRIPPGASEPCEVFAQTGVPLAYSQPYPPAPPDPSSSQSMSEDTSDVDAAHLKVRGRSGGSPDGAMNGNGALSSSDMEFFDQFAAVSSPTVSVGKTAMPDLMDSVIGRPDDTDDDLLGDERLGEEGRLLDVPVPPPAEFSDVAADVVVDSEIKVEVEGDSNAVPVTDIDDLLGLMSSSVESSPQRHSSTVTTPAYAWPSEKEKEEEEVLIATVESIPQTNLDLLNLDAPPLPTSNPPSVSSTLSEAEELSESADPPLPSCPPPSTAPNPNEGLMEDFEVVDASDCLAAASSPPVALASDGARESQSPGAGVERGEVPFRNEDNVTSLSVPGLDVRGREEDDFVTKVNIAPPEIPERCPDLKESTNRGPEPQKRIISIGPQVTKVDVVAEPKSPPVPSPRSRKPRDHTGDSSRIITVTDEDDQNAGPTVIAVDAETSPRHGDRQASRNAPGDTLVGEETIRPVSVRRDEARRPLGQPLTTHAAFETKIEHSSEGSDVEDAITPMVVQKDCVGRQYVVATTRDAIKRDTAPRKVEESSRQAVAETLIQLSNAMSLQQGEKALDAGSVPEEEVVPVAVSREEATKVLEVLSVWLPSKTKAEKPSKSPFSRMVGDVMRSETRENQVTPTEAKPAEDLMQMDFTQTVSSPPKSEPASKEEPLEDVEQVVLRRKPRAEAPLEKRERERERVTKAGQSPEPASTRRGNTRAGETTAASAEREGGVSVTEAGCRAPAPTPAPCHSGPGRAGSGEGDTRTHAAMEAGQEQSFSGAGKMSSPPPSPARSSGKAGGDSRVVTPAQNAEVTLRSSSGLGNRSLMSARRISAPVAPFKAPSLAPLKMPSKMGSLKAPPLLAGGRQAKVEYPRARCDDRPFQVDVLKGIVGLGIKVKVTGEGYVEVTEIQKNSAVEKNGHIRVGDYILSINNSELTGHSDSKVQQILRLLPRGLVKIVASALPPGQIKESRTDSGDVDSMQPSTSPGASPQASGMVSPFGVRLSARPFSAIITSDVTASSPITSPRHYIGDSNSTGDTTRPPKVEDVGRVTSPVASVGSGDGDEIHDEKRSAGGVKGVEPEVFTRNIASKSEAEVEGYTREWARPKEPEVLVQKVVLQNEAEVSPVHERPKASPRHAPESTVTVSVASLSSEPPLVAASDGEVTVKVKGSGVKVPPRVAPKPKAKPKPTPTTRGQTGGASLRERMNAYENVVAQGNPVFDSATIQKKSHGPAVTTIAVTASTDSPPTTAKFSTEIRVSDSPTHTMTKFKGPHIAEKSAVASVTEVGNRSPRVSLSSTPAKLHSGTGRKVLGVSTFSGKPSSPPDHSDVSTHPSPLSPTRRSVTSPTEASATPRFDSHPACSTLEHDRHSASTASPPTSPTGPGEKADSQPLEGKVIMEPVLNRALAPRRKSHPAQPPVTEKPTPDPLAALRRKPKHSLPELSQDDVDAAVAALAEGHKSQEKTKMPPPVPPKPRNRRSVTDQMEAALRGDVIEAAADTCIFDSVTEIQPKFVDSSLPLDESHGAVESPSLEPSPEGDEVLKGDGVESGRLEKTDVSLVCAGKTEAVPAASQELTPADIGAPSSESDQDNNNLLVLDDAIESEVEGSNPVTSDSEKTNFLSLDENIDSEVESANVLTVLVDKPVSLGAPVKTKECEEEASAAIEEPVEVVHAIPAEIAPARKEVEEEDEEKAMEEERESRSPSPPPLPSSPPPLPMSPPPFALALREEELEGVTVEDLDGLLSKDDSGLDSLSGSTGHFSSADLDAVETVTSDDLRLEAAGELPSANEGGSLLLLHGHLEAESGSSALPRGEGDSEFLKYSPRDDSPPETSSFLEETASKVVKQVCEAAYKQMSEEKPRSVYDDAHSEDAGAAISDEPGTQVNVQKEEEEELKTEARVLTETSPREAGRLDVEEVPASKDTGHRKLEAAFDALSDFPEVEEELKVSNRVFLPGDITSSKAAVFGDAFAEVAKTAPTPAPESTSLPDHKHASPSPVPRARKARPLPPSPRARDPPAPRPEVCEEFSQHVDAPVAAAPGGRDADEVDDDEAPPPLPSSRAPPVPSPQASAGRGFSARSRDEVVPASVATAAPPSGPTATAARAKDAPTDLDLTQFPDKTVNGERTRRSRDGTKETDSTRTKEGRQIDGLAMAATSEPGEGVVGGGDDAVEVKSSRRWMLISNHSVGALLEGAANSSRTITASDLSQVSLLSPKELARVIHAVNAAMDRSRQRGQYVILLVLLYRDTPDEPIGIELLAGRSGIILVRGCRPGGLAVRSGLVQAGDQVMMVNGQTSEDRLPSDLKEQLERPDQHIILALTRSEDAVFLSGNKTPLSPAGPPSTPVPPPTPTGEGETFEVIMVKGVTGVGFSLEGGIGSPRGDLPITIKRIFKGGPAEKCGKLKVQDEILKVNELDFTTMRHYEAWNHLKFLPDGEIRLLIRRA